MSCKVKFKDTIKYGMLQKGEQKSFIVLGKILYLLSSTNTKMLKTKEAWIVAHFEKKYLYQIVICGEITLVTVDFYSFFLCNFTLIYGAVHVM